MKASLPYYALWILLLTIDAPQRGFAQVLVTPRQAAPQARLTDGRLVIANELKVTLLETAARVRSRDDSGKPRAVDITSLRELHPQILRVEGRHLCSRCWLAGEEVPAHLRKSADTIPRIARNFSVILHAEAEVAAVRAELQRHPEVERVDFKVINRLNEAPNDTVYSQQWAPSVIGLESAWEVPGRGRVRVAVIDTGVELAHPDFMNQIVFEDGYADFDTGNAPGSGSRFDHGTHVAGIIGATRNNSQGVAGFSNDIELMVLNCATWNDDSSQWQIGNADDAIDDAVANGAHIINCSFGFSDDVEDEVEGAYDASVLVVHAAGNDAVSIEGHWESGSIALFTVTATMQSAAPVTDIFDPSYSNYGPGVDLAAPGTGIWSTVSPASYNTKDGTSMAAPQVSGAAALVMSMNPTLIGDESARHLLIRMAQDKGLVGYDEQYGWGALRLRKGTLQACRDATAFVSSASGFAEEGGNYDRPWRSLPAALNNTPNGTTLILNGGTTDVPVYGYPALTISKPCTLSAIPDRPVTIGN